MKTWTVLFLATLALLIVFTGAPSVIAQEKPQVVQDVSKGVTPAALPEPNVSGTWEGETLTSYGKANITLRLQQEGETVRGTYDIKGTAGAFYDISLVGTFRDGKLSLSRPQRAFAGIEARVVNGVMEGTLVGSSNVPQQLTAKKVVK